MTDCHGLKVQWWSWFEREWIWGRTDDARLPLYGLGELLRRPDAEVLIVEGEKACKAGYIRWPDMVTVCPPGGSNPAPGTDWTPLAGRSVGVLGDADDAGRTFAVKVVEACRLAGTTVRAVLEPAGGVRNAGRERAGAGGVGRGGRGGVMSNSYPIQCC